MKNRIIKFKHGHMNHQELIDFKKDVNQMNDEELDEYLNTCESEFVFSDSDINNMQNSLNEEIRAQKRQRIINRIFKISAAILLPAFFLCSILAYNYHNKIKKYEPLVSHKITIETDKGESTTTVLPDGTKISMGPLSSLKYTLASFNSDTRIVNYSGEGHFSVSKNPDAPFTLILSNVEIKVLGTVFSIYDRTDKNSAEIHLEEGSIQLVSKTTDSTELLYPGQTAIIDSQTGLIKVFEEDSNHRRTAGSSTLYFSSEPLRNITKELELYYGKECIIDNEIADIRFTGSLPTNNLQESIYVLENTLNIHIANSTIDNTLRFKTSNRYRTL